MSDRLGKHSDLTVITGTAACMGCYLAAQINVYGSKECQYIDMPDDMRDRYRYFTEADMSKPGEAAINCASRPWWVSVIA